VEGHSIESLKKLLVRCDKNVEVFEDEIEEEIKRKVSYKKIVAQIKAGDPDCDYELGPMEELVKKSDYNVEVLEGAIKKETETKRYYRDIVRELEYRRDNPPRKVVLDASEMKPVSKEAAEEAAKELDFD